MALIIVHHQCQPKPHCKGIGGVDYILRTLQKLLSKMSKKLSKTACISIEVGFEHGVVSITESGPRDWRRNMAAGFGAGLRGAPLIETARTASAINERVDILFASVPPRFGTFMPTAAPHLFFASTTLPRMKPNLNVW
jgi:hypothetical protein